MALCKECRYFFPIPEKYDDYEEGWGDCVQQQEDSKGTWWTSKRLSGEMDASKCPNFKGK
jgi:hypothetical protein